ncbi:MAG: DNA methyltransferase [Thermoanaerobaculia bacterium]
MTTLSLYWPRYRLFPYERLLAIEEASSLLSSDRIVQGPTRVVVDTTRPAAACHLTYFSAFQTPQKPLQPTIQHLIESETSGGARRQSTRYSVHGLHEYKGKFNPQVARALLNSAALPKNAQVLDPFCGSGTTLVECAHSGFRAVGTDINPLAAMIANAKSQALACDPGHLVLEAEAALRTARRSHQSFFASGSRGEYLLRWFDAEMLRRLEVLRSQITARDPSVSSILLVIASNLLREFSLQEPEDLRIRRRTSPPSERDPYEVFLDETHALAANLQVVQRHLPLSGDAMRAYHGDVRSVPAVELSKNTNRKFDAAITSPPYAMALPYIDTQRLSLVWLGLVEPGVLPSLQSKLIGSREFNGTPRSTWMKKLFVNSEKLPERHAVLCRQVLRRVGPHDGFRRQAVPSLLYRYLVGMRDSFLAIRSLLRSGAPFFLIVGHNHTVLAGQRLDIDTPDLLSELGTSVGFETVRREGLQTYQRYGLHQKNAISREELLTLRAI